MRVLNIVNWLTRGGIETMLLGAVPELQSHGVEVDICCLGGKNELDEKFTEIGCRLHYFKRRMQWARGGAELTQVLNHHSYDLVHSHFGFTSGAIANAASKLGVPIAVSVHNAVGPAARLQRLPVGRTIRQAWLNWHQQQTLRHANAIIGHSRVNLDQAFPDWISDPKRFQVLLNGVAFPDKLIDRTTARRRLGLIDNQPCLLHVGSFIEQKNHAGLLQIFQGVLQQIPNAKLILVGDGVLQACIREQALRRDIGDNVVFTGSQEDVWQFYAAADVFIFPSLYEGFGNVMVEAQSAGVPIVASAIPAHFESVCTQQHKYLFAMPDYHRAAELVVQQIQYRDEMVLAQSRDRVRERFSIQRYSKDLLSIYETIKTPEVHARLGVSTGLCPAATKGRAKEGNRVGGPFRELESRGD